MSPTSIFRLSSRQYLRAQPIRTLKPCLSIRSFTQSTRIMYPRKDSQDRNSINTEATEYSKSGTDDASARQEEAAFDPSNTDPQAEKDVAGQGNEGNPLEVSPANPEVSKPRGETEGGAEHAAENKKSGGGSPKKAGGK